MAGNLDQSAATALMRIGDQLSLIQKSIEVQNELLRKLTVRLTGDAIRPGDQGQ